MRVGSTDHCNYVKAAINSWSPTSCSVFSLPKLRSWCQKTSQVHHGVNTRSLLAQFVCLKKMNIHIYTHEERKTKNDSKYWREAGFNDVELNPWRCGEHERYHWTLRKWIKSTESCVIHNVSAVIFTTQNTACCWILIMYSTQEVHTWITLGRTEERSSGFQRCNYGKVNKAVKERRVRLLPRPVMEFKADKTNLFRLS